MGGPTILKKKWGDLCFQGGPTDLLANSGGTYLSIYLSKIIYVHDSTPSPPPHPPSMILIVVLTKPITKNVKNLPAALITYYYSTFIDI